MKYWIEESLYGFILRGGADVPFGMTEITIEQYNALNAGLATYKNGAIIFN